MFQADWRPADTLPPDMGRGYSSYVLVYIDFRSQGGGDQVRIDRYVYWRSQWESYPFAPLTYWAPWPAGPEGDTTSRRYKRLGLTDLHVGDRVRLTRDIYEEGEDVPPGYLARRGEVVIVRRVGGDQAIWPYAVSHEGRNDSSFGVCEDEITQQNGGSDE